MWKTEKVAFMEVPESKYKYGIVIDSGSSGSRVQIYKWPDPQYVAKNTKDSHILESPPKITQEANWTKKITPGISTFADKTGRIWSDHFKDLIEFAETIVPQDKYDDTPIFVLATAGMRLLSPKDQKRILKNTCSELKKNSPFVIRGCEDHVQIIDGEIEGLYGWLGLNYLMGQLDDYLPGDRVHESIGFMDMGGASTQIAFMPSDKDDIEKHREDISTLTLRNINGLTQEWNVFVETWLGFGANQARKRYLSQLVEISRINADVGSHISDPCMPKDATIEFEYEDKTYDIKGIGNYEMCIRTIYPLLLKNVPCKDTPCLFNGVHGPRLNFEKDKFVGISEYWYTANDVFQSGGEYNFKIFNERVKDFCELPWETVLYNSEQGQYSNLDPDEFLKDACFKASWVINVLHDGFELPRIDLEIPKEDVKQGEEEITQVHVPFKSADSVDGNELSWTLGKILLYASSEIPSNGQLNMEIGVQPSEISGKSFVPAGGYSGEPVGYESDDDESFGFLIPMIVFLAVSLLLYNIARRRYAFARNRKFNHIKQVFYTNVSKIPGLNNIFNAEVRSNQLNQNEYDISMEEGTLSSSQSSPNLPNLAQLRTRSTINLHELEGFDGDHDTSTNFLNKPFVLPKKSPVFYHSQNNSRESVSLQRSLSAFSVPKKTNME